MRAWSDTIALTAGDGKADGCVLAEGATVDVEDDQKPVCVYVCVPSCVRAGVYVCVGEPPAACTH
jgi:hypothetical protein